MKRIVPSVLVMFVLGCGGGNSSDPDGEGLVDTKPKVQRNLALLENGATISSTYDADGANYVIDGDTTSSYYWTGNVTGDSLTIDFGQISHISRIDIYNTRIFLGGNNIWVVEISENGIDWQRTVVFGSGYENAKKCTEVTLYQKEGYVSCVFDTKYGNTTFLKGPDARYLKLTVTETDASKILATNIFEITVDGK